MTAKQRAARAKFKAVVAEAKKLRKKNPKLTQAQAVKQAFAISYGKKRAGTISKVNVMSKSSLQKQYKENEQNNNHSENVVLLAENFGSKNDIEKAKEILKTRNKQGYLTLQQGREADQIHNKLYKKLFSSKVGKIRKKETTKVKAKKRRSTEMHTDTKSHNVNIRVVSGISKITGIPHKAKYYITYKLFDIKRVDYFDKLPKDRYISPSERIVYVMKNTDNGTSLVPLRYTKNDNIVKK
jgi:hypothetical protein